MGELFLLNEGKVERGAKIYWTRGKLKEKR